MPDQFCPLERSPSGELFLRLPPPHENIIVTPPRPSDAAPLVAIINDPLVYPWIGRPTDEYTLAQGEALVSEFTAASEKVIAALNAAADDEDLVCAEDCPVRAIREVQPDGETLFLGNVTIKRANWWDKPAAERESLIAANVVRKTGDPDIIWQLSDYIASSHHRRGIVTAVLKALVEQWAIPRMRVRKMHVCAFIGNVGSVRVFEKNGFVLTETLEDCTEVRGEKRGFHVLDWEYRAA